MPQHATTPADTTPATTTTTTTTTPSNSTAAAAPATAAAAYEDRLTRLLPLLLWLRIRLGTELPLGQVLLCRWPVHDMLLRQGLGRFRTTTSRGPSLQDLRAKCACEHSFLHHANPNDVISRAVVRSEETFVLTVMGEQDYIFTHV